MKVRVRLFAIQRELAGTREVTLELPEPGTIDDAWSALVERFPALSPGRAFVRFARNADYADATTMLADGDELAVIPPVSGGAGGEGVLRILEVRSEPFGTSLLDELSERLVTDEDGAVVAFIGRTRSSPGTPAPGQEAEAARHAGRTVEALEYEAHDAMVDAVLGQIADEIAVRFEVHRLAIVHRSGAVPLGEASVAVVAVAPHRDAAFSGGAVRHRRDEGTGADLEGGTLRGRARLDRGAGTDRPGRPGRVRVYISVDMEGVGGVSHPNPTDPKDARYPMAVELMLGEANAAIEGALAAGATEILVNDSHASMYNLPPEALHPSATLLQGQKHWSMVAGAGPDHPWDVALFIGYHARAGHPRGTLAHTYSGRPVETRLDGRTTGEYGLNALALGAWGIPVGLVAGDDALAAETEPWLPWAERVITKIAHGGSSAASVHPSVARERIRDGADRAVRRAAAGELSLLEVGSPVVIEVDYARGVIADHAAILPGAERVGDRTVRLAFAGAVSAYRGFLAANRLAGSVD